MDKKPYITRSHDVHLDGEYSQWLTELIGRYRHAQVKAAVKVNAEKLLWNWQTGRDLVRRKAEEKWGSGIVEQLSLDLQAAFPNDTGFGTSNLWYMKKWYLFYSERLQRIVGEYGRYHDKFLHQLGGETQRADNSAVAKLHHVCGVFMGDENDANFPQLFACVPFNSVSAITVK